MSYILSQIFREHPLDIFLVHYMQLPGAEYEELPGIFGQQAEVASGDGDCEGNERRKHRRKN
jgi:hypothetical protein